MTIASTTRAAADASAYGPGGHRPGIRAASPAMSCARQLRRQRLAERRRFLPRDDAACGGTPTTRSETSTPDPSSDESGQRAQRRLERQRRRAEHERARHVQFGHRTARSALAAARRRRGSARGCRPGTSWRTSAKPGLARVLDVSRAASAMTTTSAPTAASIDSAAVSVVLKLSMGEDCWMSSALPRATDPAGSIRRTSAHAVAHAPARARRHRQARRCRRSR